jgi:hypothetical protein
VLQKAISESSGRGANIQAIVCSNINIPVLQSSLKLETTATHVSQIFSEQANRTVERDLCTGFLNFLAIDQNLARKDERLRPLSRWHERTFHQHFVESRFHHGAEKLKSILSTHTTKVPATTPVQSAEPSVDEPFTST